MSTSNSLSPSLPPGWRSSTLGKEITFQRGFDITKKDQEPGQYPVISSSGFQSTHRDFKVKGPGVITGRKGTLGMVFYSEGDYWPHDTTLWVKDFHNNHPKFAYYFLKTLHLEQYDCGASNPTINRNHIHLLPVLFPALDIQKKIAAFLSNYDYLIENNTRRMQVLEEMARMIYQEWFVNFRFPGHEQAKFVESPLGKIPEGWEISQLGQHLDSLESGKRPKGGATSSDGVPSIGAENVMGIGRHNFATEKYVPKEFFAEMRKGIVRHKDVAIYKDGAYIGRSTCFRDSFPYSECCVNEHVFLLRTNDKHLTQNALYLWLQQPDTVKAIRATNANAAQPGINQQSINGLRIIVPNPSIATAFDQIVEPLLKTIINLAKRNYMLCKTRDLLLPKLISGELDVSELNIEV